MTLQQSDIDHILTQIKPHFDHWIEEKSLERPSLLYEMEIRERIVRVEESLRHQRELMQQGFELMNKRFEQVEKRFEQIDKRFEQVDKRFEQIDKRFEQVDKRFEIITQRIDRFMFWSFSITIATSGIIISALKYWR